MRVIAGQFRSRQLKSLKGLALRPTSDRLRETVFNVLAPLIVGARFLDVFAGTGAIGIEALSRGAAEAVFIESHQPAAALIKQNLASLGIRTGVSVLAMDAVRGLEKLGCEAECAVRPCLYRSTVCGCRTVCAGAGGGGEVAAVSSGVADCRGASASV